MIEFYEHWLHSPGYLTARLPVDLLQEINEQVEKIKADNYEGYINVDQHLAGHLAHQFDLTASKNLEDFLCFMAIEYDTRFDYFNSVTHHAGPQRLKLNEMWINFQKKHDFNPLHDHNGVMSFVIWHTIPYDVKEELQQYKNGTFSSCASTFEFVYTDSLGNIRNKALPINKEWEGVICMFPAKMRHCVQPFYTSDDYRISIAGNIGFANTN